MKKKGFLLILCMMFLLTGCFGSVELNEVAIVVSTGIGKESSTNKYVVSIEILNQNKREVGGDSESVIIQGIGDTIAEAIFNAASLDSRELYWDFCRIVSIDEQVASEDGLQSVMDYILRNYKPRLSMNILVSKGKTSVNLAEEGTQKDNLNTLDINQMIVTNSLYSVTESLQIFDVINLMEQEGIEIIIPVIRTALATDIETTISVDGMAVFKEGLLVGYLSAQDTETYLLLIGEAQSPYVTIDVTPLLDTNDEIIGRSYLTCQLSHINVDTKPAMSGSQVGIDIQIHAHAFINQLDMNLKTVEGELKKELEDIIARHIEIEAEKLIRQVRQDYGSDIFGFGRLIKRKMPDEWKKWRENWNDAGFMLIPINIDVNIEIRDDEGVR